MRRFAGAACLLTLTAGLAIGADQIDSKQAQRDASADTDPNSAFWRGVAPILAERDGSGNPVPGHRTEIRSRWTGRNLYFLFICPYEQLNLKPEPKTETETNELWKWDVAEVFIGSDFKNIRRYKEFEISPQSRVDRSRYRPGRAAPRRRVGVELRIPGLGPYRPGRQDLVRVHADSLCCRRFACRRSRKYTQGQFLPFPRSAPQSQVDRLATYSPSHLSRPRSFRDAAACGLIFILADNLGKYSTHDRPKNPAWCAASDSSRPPRST